MMWDHFKEIHFTFFVSYFITFTSMSSSYLLPILLFLFCLNFCLCLLLLLLILFQLFIICISVFLQWLNIFLKAGHPSVLLAAASGRSGKQISSLFFILSCSTFSIKYLSFFKLLPLILLINLQFISHFHFLILTIIFFFIVFFQIGFIFLLKTIWHHYFNILIVINSHFLEGSHIAPFDKLDLLTLSLCFFIFFCSPYHYNYYFTNYTFISKSFAVLFLLLLH